MTTLTTETKPEKSSLSVLLSADDAAAATADETMSQRSQEALGMMHRDESTTFVGIHLPENISQRFDDASNIGFQVGVKLEREKDRNRPKRVHLANEVKNILDHELDKVVGYRPYYPAFAQPVVNKDDNNNNNIQAVLFVEVAVASDGNRYGRMCCGEFYMGGSKLVLVWCLQSLDTPEQQVILGQRTVLTDPKPGVGSGTWAVKNLTYRMIDTITEEVNKTLRHKRLPSCSSLTKSHSDSKLHVT